MNGWNLEGRRKGFTNKRNLANSTYENDTFEKNWVKICSPILIAPLAVGYMPFAI